MSANEILTFRNKIGMPQEELSEVLGVYDSHTISRWENGHRKPNEVIRRLFCLLNDLPKKEAEEFVRKLGQYKLRKR